MSLEAIRLRRARDAPPACMRASTRRSVINQIAHQRSSEVISGHHWSSLSIHLARVDEALGRLLILTWRRLIRGH